jgi:hypothetical protein
MKLCADGWHGEQQALSNFEISIWLCTEKNTQKSLHFSITRNKNIIIRQEVAP